MTNSVFHIPFMDMALQDSNVRKEIEDAISTCIRENTFIGGGAVRQFEHDFLTYLNIQHAIGCGNGTDALEIALAALNISQGDEVLVPALTWISCSEAITNRGATPVFIDIDPVSYTMDPNQLSESISSNTRAIMPVHLYGQSCQMSEICQFARDMRLAVIEDCAQAHGAEHQGQKVGTLGDVSCFSFYPGKNLGAYGDAGMVCTNDEQVADFCKKMRNHGQTTKHTHHFEGRNSRLDAIQAAILSIKLSHLDSNNSLRRQAASQYTRQLTGAGDLILPTPVDNTTHAYHLYVIRHPQRDKLRQHLAERGIETVIHYPTPLPSIPCLQAYSRGKRFPNADEVSQTALSLPLYPGIPKEHQKAVIEAILDFI